MYNITSILYIQQNKHILINYMEEGAGNKQMQEYKQFTTITQIRKITQDAINPVVKSIQSQMNQLLLDNTDLRKNLTRIDDVFNQNSEINKRIQENFKSLQNYKNQRSQKQRQDDRRTTRFQTANEKLLLQIHSMKNLLTNQEDVLVSMKQKNQKSGALYANLQTRNDSAVKSMQQKYISFTRQILEEARSMKSLYQTNQSHIQVITEVFKRERNILEQKQKGLQLFFQERQSMNNKFEDLYSKIINSVTRQEFQGFRKSQIKALQQKQDEIDKQILQLIPMSLRQVLPEIQIRLKQVDKIKILNKRITENQRKIDELNKKFIKNVSQTANKVNELEGNIQQGFENVRLTMKQRMQEVKVSIQKGDQGVEQKIESIKATIQIQMEELIERETSELYKTIQNQLQAKKQTIQDDREQDLRQDIEEIKSIKQMLLQRTNQIKELGQTIENTLEKYSSKITRIKSDYELFADNIRKQISGVIKFRKNFGDNLQNIGGILSYMAEMLLIGGSIQYQNIMSDYQTNQHEIFVTNSDGIIYEFKGQNKTNKMLYRRQKVEPKEFIKSYMYSMTIYFDQIFTKHPFLAWNNKKPSEFFNQFCLQNYALRVNKNSEANLKNSLTQVNNFEPLTGRQGENQYQNPMSQLNGNYMPKAVSRTIQSRMGGAKVRQQKSQNCPEKAGQLKKNYSIKKPRTNMQKSRYEQCFFSSRSGCRSRVSQAIG